MTERPPYECQECARRVSSTAYRSSCPDCGGHLRPATVAGSSHGWRAAE